MRYRPLDANGDYTIGVPFLVNSPNTVAQAILTRLKLFQGEWFIDTTDGTPWLQSILGKQFRSDPNSFIRQRILGTPGVTSIVSYSSSISGRSITVSGTVNSQFGAAIFSATLTLPFTHA
jgi:hypothetical protein